jgi:hypothetical protein
MADSRFVGAFDQDDIFPTAFANVLTEAVVSVARADKMKI